jgi:ATP-binding cassette, subfamily F, member 3
VALLAVDKVTKRFKDQIILDQVSFTIQPSDRVALVGKNGIGKTTLLELVAGKQHADTGAITRSRACVIDYIEQEKSEYLDLTLFDFVAAARSGILRMKQEIHDLEHHLEIHPGDSESLERLGALQHTFEQQGGFSLETDIATILTGLGFRSDRYNDRLRNFSGGEKNRAGLARILAGSGNLLLLDEPTNHLDIESTTWLEDYLAKLDRAWIIVSHDRTFLTATASQVWEITYPGKIEVYHGGFDQYMAEREHRRELAAHHYRHQQEEIKRIEDFIQRNMAGQKTRQAQSKLKYLNRIKRLPPPQSDGKGPSISVQSSGRSFAHVLAVENLAIGYGSEILVQDLDIDVYRGDKIGLIGRNGSGKSTLLKTLIGELEPVSGTIRLGNNVNVAYFDQELSDLNEELTVLDSIWAVDPSAEPGPLRSFLARFGFTGDDALKRVSALSGGEKTKLCLALLLYHPANFVILDEPTNHLDIFAREALEGALREYDGSCLIVSHDRFFLDQVVDKVIYLDAGRARVFAGNYSEFHERMLQANVPGPKVKNEKQRQEYFEFREQSKRRARLKKEIESVRETISRLETELADAVNEMNYGVAGDDWEALQSLTERRRHLEEDILALYVRLEELEGTQLD